MAKTIDEANDIINIVKRGLKFNRKNELNNIDYDKIKKDLLTYWTTGSYFHIKRMDEEAKLEAKLEKDMRIYKEEIFGKKNLKEKA